MSLLRISENKGSGDSSQRPLPKVGLRDFMNAQYFGDISLGTPPQPQSPNHLISLLYDTGSPLTWVWRRRLALLERRPFTAGFTCPLLVPKEEC